MGCRGEMCMLLTPYRDSCACTFLECMEDYSTSGDLSSSHPRKRAAVRIRDGHTYFATEAQSDGTQWNTPQFHLAMQWLVLATEQCSAGVAR